MGTAQLVFEADHEVNRHWKGSCAHVLPEVTGNDDEKHFIYENNKQTKEHRKCSHILHTHTTESINHG
jgi:hypothetical protein